MLQVVDKNEIAERKPYKFSEKVSAKIRQRRKEREQNRKNMAQIIVRIDTLDEIVPGDIIYGNNLCNTLKIQYIGRVFDANHDKYSRTRQYKYDKYRYFYLFCLFSGEIMANECPFLNKELKERTTSIINDYIKEKETVLTQKQEEYANLPNRYVVKGVIKKEIDDLTGQINSMKKTVSEIGCGK